MRVLAFGDSITQGFHDEVAGGWCNRLVVEVMKRGIESDYEKSIINLGISGDTSADLLKRIKAEVESRILKYPSSTYDIALIAIGVNDTQYSMETKLPKISLEDTEINLKKAIDVCHGFNMRVVFVGPSPVYEPRIQPMTWKPSHGYSNTLIRERSDLIRRVATDMECDFIDTTDIYGGKEEQVLPDGIHPNASGHNMLYVHIKSCLEKLDIL